MGIFKNNLVIALLTIIVLSAGGAYYLTSTEPTSEGLLTSESVGGDGGIERELLATLLELRSLQFNTSIFESETFTNLKDFSREIPEEPYGRSNPFAPVGTDPSFSTTTRPR